MKMKKLLSTMNQHEFIVAKFCLPERALKEKRKLMMMESEETGEFQQDNSPPVPVARVVQEEDDESLRHEEGVNIATMARFRPSPEMNRSGSDSASRFKYDSAKPWYYFGTGSVDKTGTQGGPAWVPDSATAQCMQCRKGFDFWNRRHHCRYCGQIFCGSCSKNFKLLPVTFGVREPQRVCDQCCLILEPMQEELASTISNATRSLTFNLNDSGSYLGSPISFSMSAEIKKATQTVHNFFGSNPNSTIIKDQYIPAMLLRQAKGIAFLTVFKAGLFFSGRFGTGIVVGKDRQGNWTAPSAIGLAGVGWGAQIGGEVCDLLIILNTEASVDAFSGKAQIALGPNIGLCAGPLGRTGEASMNVGDDGAIAPCYTYSQSKGLFAGISLEGSAITERADVNERFYGRQHDPKDLLSGRIAPPNAAQPLYDALNQACHVDQVGSVQFNNPDHVNNSNNGIDV